MAQFSIYNILYVKDNINQFSLLYHSKYYNIDLNSKLTPYVGLGIGRLKSDDGDVSNTETSYQGMVGSTYSIVDNFDLLVEYKYITTKYDFVDIDSNNIILGLKYTF